MILALNIEDKNNGSWILIEGKKQKDLASFVIDRDNDKVFMTLDVLLSRNKLVLEDLRGLILNIKEAGLTQVKIFTAIINTFAWQLDVAVAGRYYDQKSLETLMPQLLVDLESSKNKALQVEYLQNPDISISKKSPKYVIKK